MIKDLTFTLFLQLFIEDREKANQNVQDISHGPITIELR